MIKKLYSKPINLSPGPGEGQEMCVHKGLTEYCQELEVPAFVMQIWEGDEMTGYVLIDMATKKTIFSDHRYGVIEYMIECISKEIHHSVVDEANTSS